jgi:hypothetical protein
VCWSMEADEEDEGTRHAAAGLHSDWEVASGC